LHPATCFSLDLSAILGNIAAFNNATDGNRFHRDIIEAGIAAVTIRQALQADLPRARSCCLSFLSNLSTSYEGAMYLGGLRQPEVKPARTTLPLLWFLMPHAT
jgi:hypothetical protein